MSVAAPPTLSPLILRLLSSGHPSASKSTDMTHMSLPTPPPCRLWQIS